MRGLHQSDGNPNLDITARHRVGLPALCVQATRYPLRGSHHLHTQLSIQQGKKGGEVPVLLEACLQVYSLLCPLRLLQVLLQGLRLVGLDISVHDMHVVNTVSPIQSEVTDQEVSLLFCGLCRWHIFPVGRTCGPGRLSLKTLHGATCEDKGVVVHMREGE